MKVSIQGERGSNSHMAALEMLGGEADGPIVVPSMLSAEALDRVVAGEVDAAVLPIENTLHGSVIEHYDLLSERPLWLAAEFRMRVRHNVIAAPGVAISEVREVLSHAVALSQCRGWLRGHPGIRAVPFYDTAGGVKEILQRGRRDAAAIAPALAAEIYGGIVLEAGIEDHVENLTRFHLVVPGRAAIRQREACTPNKMTVQITLEHRPGSLVLVLQGLAESGADLTKIESRPVPGRPWEYVFYVDLRFDGGAAGADRLIEVARQRSAAVKELGRYEAAQQGGLRPMDLSSIL